VGRFICSTCCYILYALTPYYSPWIELDVLQQ
jgi:hypothetical protein